MERLVIINITVKTREKIKKIKRELSYDEFLTKLISIYAQKEEKN